MDLLCLADLALAAASLVAAPIAVALPVTALPAAAVAAGESSVGAAEPRPTLTIFAAASLTEVFHALGAELERIRPGLTTRFNFAGSQQLALQLRQGAAADVFASADQRWMADVQAHGLVDGEPRAFARNRLVVIVPASNPARIARLRDLARPGVKLVLASDAVPAGAYSRAMLRNLAAASGFPPDYARRVLANVVSEEENVKAVVTKVQLGEADAGIAYRSDVMPRLSRRLGVLDVPERCNVEASYLVAPLKGAANPDAARVFIELILGPVGQRILREHGFEPYGLTVRRTPS